MSGHKRDARRIAEIFIHMNIYKDDGKSNKSYNQQYLRDQVGNLLLEKKSISRFFIGNFT